MEACCQAEVHRLEARLGCLFRRPSSAATESTAATCAVCQIENFKFIFQTPPRPPGLPVTKQGRTF